jgi:hypothetical protein
MTINLQGTQKFAKYLLMNEGPLKYTKIHFQPETEVKFVTTSQPNKAREALASIFTELSRKAVEILNDCINCWRCV